MSDSPSGGGSGGVGFTVFAGLNALWTLFFLIGMSSAGTDDSTVKNIPWYYDHLNGCDSYVGLLASYVECGPAHFSSTFDDCADDNNDCKTCYSNGSAATAFMFFAWVICAVSVWSNYTRSSSDSSSAKTITLVSNLAVLLCSIIAFGAFKNCANTISGTQMVGAGQALPLVAFFGICFNFFFNLAIPVGGGAVSFGSW